MYTHLLIVIINIMLIILWVYAAVIKLTDVKKFRESLITQVIPRWMAKTLVWALPLSELLSAGLLLFAGTRLWGMYLSALMMLVFTVYVGCAAYLVFTSYPCPCGGLFTRIGWKKHFKVNIFFTLLSLLGILLIKFG
ncbi:hypothetical protein HNQ91_001817 [Filimonas zeae]|uniref:MauE/DoxX family redox-associated membrane protein n=1 Tax=Filimonas zeae TaxID=1737353 RepID=UPI0016640355|nr:MauE/DoxX family redox-associated membrane protein [Filimonas zeae]MDR6338766.1 hypothetical protein [Filimonas zeae]